MTATSSIVALFLGVALAAGVEAPSNEPADPLRIVDDLEREQRVLENLESRLSRMENQVTGIVAARQRGVWARRDGDADPLANVPSRVVTKTLRLERTVREDALLYDIAATNASAFEILEAIARTSARELQFHSDVARRHLTGRLNLALENTDILEAIEIVAGAQGLDATVDERSVTVGPTHTLTDGPLPNKLRERAMAAYQRAILRYPAGSEAPRAYIGIARYYQAGGFHTAATQMAATVHQNYPQSDSVGDAQLLIARSQQAVGRYSEARESYYAYVDTHPTADDHAAAEIQIADTFLKERKASQAVAVFEEILREHPQSEEATTARLMLARCLADRGDYEKAIVQLRAAERAQTAPSKRGDTSFMVVRCQMELGRCEQARARLRRIIEESPSLTAAERAYYLLGDTYLSEGKGAAALEVYHGAAKNFPDGTMRDTLPVRICRAYLAMDLYVMVESKLKTMSPEAIRSPEMRPVLLALLRYRLDQGDSQAVLALLDDPRWGNDVNTDPDALMIAARAHMAAEQIQPCLEKAEAAARLSRGDEQRAEALRLIGTCHRRRNDPASAAMAYAGEIP